MSIILLNLCTEKNHWMLAEACWILRSGCCRSSSWFPLNRGESIFQQEASEIRPALFRKWASARRLARLSYCTVPRMCGCEEWVKIGPLRF